MNEKVTAKFEQEEQEMIFATIVIDGTSAVPAIRKKIPAGIVGAKIRMEFDKSWQGLRKMAVFQAMRDADNVTKDVLIENEEAVEIPWEVVDRPAHMLRVGVYGTSGEEDLVIPTLWADLGRVYYAADPSGDESTDPSLPVWAQLQQQVDELKQSGGSGGVDFKTDETLTLKNGVLSVNTTDVMEQDNTLPITSAGAFAVVGNIEALLKTI